MKTKRAYMGLFDFLDAPTPTQSEKVKEILKDEQKAGELLEAIRKSRNSKDHIGRVNGYKVSLVGKTTQINKSDEA